MTRSSDTQKTDSSSRNRTAEGDSYGSADTSGKRVSTADASQGATDEERDSPLEEETVDQGELPLDQVFEMLKNERRRHVLRYLWENDGEATLGTLAEHIAAIENDTTVASLSSAQRKRVYVGLYQSHLPKMASNDIIEFDKNRGTIEIGRNAAQTRPYLEDSTEIPWGMLSLATSLLGAVLLAVSQFVGGLSSAVVASALLVAVAVLGVAQTQ